MIAGRLFDHSAVDYEILASTYRFDTQVAEREGTTLRTSSVRRGDNMTRVIDTFAPCVDAECLR
jgi:hypothetical protein